MSRFCHGDTCSDNSPPKLRVRPALVIMRPVVVPSGEDCELLVAAVDVEECEIAPHGAFHARKVPAQFVVPTVFGFVAHDFIRVVYRPNPISFIIFCWSTSENICVLNPPALYPLATET